MVYPDSYNCYNVLFFQENLLRMLMPEQDFNLLECVSYTGDVQSAMILFTGLIDLYQSEKAIEQMTRQNHIELANLIFPCLRNSLHITCGLGHWEVFDFLINICTRAGNCAWNLLTTDAMERPHMKKFKKRIICKLQPWRDWPINFVILHNNGEFFSKLLD